jgi:hypothetical protein
MNLAHKRFGLSAICLQLIAVAIDYILVSHHLSASRLSALLSISLVAMSVPIAVIGLMRDHTRLFAVVACVLMWPIIVLIGGFHGVS